MKGKKQDVMERMCMIQRQFEDAVVFRVGITEDGKHVDIISASNAFTKQEEGKKKKTELEVQLPEVPDYIG